MLLIGGGVVALVTCHHTRRDGKRRAQPTGARAGSRASCAGGRDGDLQRGANPSGAEPRSYPRSTPRHPDYNSNPPTSGWHWANPQDWGIYTSQQFQEQLVHNLEHGGIVIQYNDLTSADVQRLTSLVSRDSYHMILAPYPGLPAGVRVAYTAWTHLQSCDGIDENAIHAFTNAFRNKGPELVP